MIVTTVNVANPRIDLHLRDCITGMAEVLAPDSIDLIVTSIPFEDLFVYSGKPEDVGNNGSTIDLRTGRFALNLRFVITQMFRVLRPGCVACIHIQQLLAYKNQHGYQGRRNFRDAAIDLFRTAGFDWTGEFVIPKDPQRMAERLQLHSLQFKTGYARSGCLLAPAVNDYVLIFWKPGEHPYPPCPLIHTKNKRGKNKGWVTLEEWVRDAHGVWADILEVDVLADGRALDAVKEHKKERHPCPLQLEVIRRCVNLYTNPISIQPNVTVLDPFMGIGSTAYVCAGGLSPVAKLGLAERRNVIGFELKESYHRASIGYVAQALEGPKTRETKSIPGMEAA